MSTSTESIVVYVYPTHRPYARIGVSVRTNVAVMTLRSQLTDSIGSILGSTGPRSLSHWRSTGGPRRSVPTLRQSLRRSLAAHQLLTTALAPTKAAAGETEPRRCPTSMPLVDAASMPTAAAAAAAPTVAVAATAFASPLPPPAPMAGSGGAICKQRRRIDCRP